MERLGEDIREVVRDGKCPGAIFPVVQLVDLASLNGLAEFVLIVPDHRKAVVENVLFLVVIEGDGHRGVQGKSGLGQRFGVPVADDHAEHEDKAEDDGEDGFCAIGEPGLPGKIICHGNLPSLRPSAAPWTGKTAWGIL